MKFKEISKKIDNIYHVNVYYTVDAPETFFGSEFIDVYDGIFEVEDEDAADELMNYFCELYKDNKGYTICVTLMNDNENYSGFHKIK